MLFEGQVGGWIQGIRMKVSRDRQRHIVSLQKQWWQMPYLQTMLISPLDHDQINITFADLLLIPLAYRERVVGDPWRRVSRNAEFTIQYPN